MKIKTENGEVREVGYAIGYYPDQNVCRARERLVDNYAPVNETGKPLTMDDIKRKENASYENAKSIRAARLAVKENINRARRDPNAPGSKYR